MAAEPRIRNRSLPLLLSQSREAVMQHFRPLLNHFGLTEQQWRVLRVLMETGGLEPRQISERCQLLGPSLTGILSRLEDMDLVRRTRLESDQRRVLVTLTETASELITTMAPVVEAQYRLLERAVGKEVLDGLYGILDDFLSVLEKTEVPTVDFPDDAEPAPAPRRGRAKRGVA